MIDYIALIDKYYAGQPELRHVLVTHSRQVADRALAIVDRHPEWEEQGLVDRTFIEEAAMLHDIGIIFCHAPKIYAKSCLFRNAIIVRRVWKKRLSVTPISSIQKATSAKRWM